VVTTYLYDSLNRLTNLTHQAGTTNLATYSYQVNASGRRTNAVEVVRQEDGIVSDEHAGVAVRRAVPADQRGERLHVVGQGTTPTPMHFSMTWRATGGRR
jgi:hypothetical protein